MPNPFDLTGEVALITCGGTGLAYGIAEAFAASGAQVVSTGRAPRSNPDARDDIGWAAVYLSSPAARFINGIVLPVDGGASIGF